MIAVQPLSPANDPWEPMVNIRRYGKHTLTSIEISVTNLCNLRCEHCAVGYVLTTKEGEKLPLELLFRKMDEVGTLTTLSITGGEPSYSEQTIDEYVVPLLKYAKKRGLRTQINSNLTLAYERYERMAPFLDVMHISYNYTGPEDFHRIVYGRSTRPAAYKTAEKLFQAMVDNAKRLSAAGVLVSAETMLSRRTVKHLAEIHRQIVEMGCLRQEVHPMYPSDFAENLELLTLDELREAIEHLITVRDPKVWMLFGTLPFYPCSPDERDRRLIKMMRRAPNLSIRNDPDGQNRLNIDAFTGDIRVTDFADVPPLGNILTDGLTETFNRWMSHPLRQKFACHCPEALCTGPNLLVAHSYYEGVDFRARKAILD